MGLQRMIVMHMLDVPPSNDKVFENKDGEVTKIHGCSVAYGGPEKVVKAYEWSRSSRAFREDSISGNMVKPSGFLSVDMIVVLELGN